MFKQSLNTNLRAAFCSLLVALIASLALAQTTQFTYQGLLNDGGSPANGQYDLQIKLFDALAGGVQQGATVTLDNVQVTNGLFNVTLDFGAAAFPGANRFLEIGVRPGTSTGAYTALTPRQQLTSTPYSIRSLSAATADGLSVACVNCVTSSQIGSLPTGSGNYIQNNPSSQQANSSFNISGDGIVGGSLGIGTSSPARPLEISHFSPGQLRLKFRSIVDPSLSKTFDFSVGSSGLSVQEYNQTGTLLGTRLTIKSGTGEIGIGTDSPTANLHVAGRILASGDLSDGSFGALTGLVTSGNGRAVYGHSSGGFGVWGETQGTLSYGGYFINRNGTGLLASGDSSQPTTPIVKLHSFGTQVPLNFIIGSTEKARVRADGFGNLVFASLDGSEKNLHFRAGTDVTTNLIVHSGTGNVGIGIGNTVPGARLHVEGTSSASSTPIAVIESSGSQTPLAFRNSSGELGRIRVNSSGEMVLATTGGTAKNIHFRAGDDSNTDVFIEAATGNMGIGDTSPSARLSISAGGIRAINASNDSTTTATIGGTNANGLGGHFRNTAGGTALQVDGWTRTDVLQITGGSDLSEQFEINETTDGDPRLGRSIQSGMVVSIDPANPGKLTLSSQAYDRRVAGIISGAGGITTGMLMGQHGSIADGKQPVALTGRVYCWVDAKYGVIKPGDLLTTSPVPGYAMKVTNHTKAQGATIGKAMTELKSGKGLVLVLVSLQ